MDQVTDPRGAREGGTVSDRAVMTLGALAGAVAGALAGYYWFTEPGRRDWLAFERQADQLLDRFGETQRTAIRLAAHLETGRREWRAFRDMRGEAGVA